MPPKCRKCGGDQKQVDFTWVCLKCEKHLLPKETPTSVEHTPGPWSTCVWDKPSWVVKAHKMFITQTVGGNDEANARLISAAPELLAACEFCLKRIEVALDGELGPVLRDAIAKAKGVNVA